MKTSPAPRLFKIVAILGIVVAVGGCLTLNVNVKLPEAAVQSETDSFVRELYRAKKKDSGTEPASEPTSKPAQDKKSSALPELGIPEAWAEGIFKILPEARRIGDQLVAHLPEVLAQKRAGVLGESNEGQLVVKAPEKLKVDEKKKVEKLVSEENSLRNQLYDAILKSNGLSSDRRKQIEQSFSRSFQGESPSGTWMQDLEGKWSQKQ